MNAAELADRVADADPKLTKTQAKEAVDTVFEGIRAAALKGEEVSLPGFGKFKVQDKPARMGRNPRTKEAVQIPATRKVVFKPAKAFKEALAK
jgi:DNA-binding protein HU-beta